MKSYLFRGKLARPKDFLACLQIEMCDYSYLVRQRGNIKHSILDFLTALASPNLFQRKTFFELNDVDDFVASHSGMAPDSKLTSPKDRAEQEIRIHATYEHSPRSRHFQYNPAAFSVIVKYCQAQQIPLVLLWLPHQSSVYRHFWYQAPYTELWFRQKFEEFGQQQFVYPLYLNNLEENCGYYADFRHLSTWGCIKASEMLGDALGKPKYSGLIQARPLTKEDQR